MGDYLDVLAANWAFDFTISPDPDGVGAVVVEAAERYLRRARPEPAHEPEVVAP